MKIKNTTLVLLGMFFLIVNVIIFFLTSINAQYKIDVVLNNNLKSLNTHYKILLQTQKTTASTIYKSTIQIPKILEIISQANDSTKEKKDKLRDELHKLLEKKYEIIKEKGVFQYHFVLANNESFYRAHKPRKFGDDLTNIRSDFKYVNKLQKQIRGFSQGRTSHGFRNTFPLFDKNNKHIGAMEVSFSSDSFQWYLNNISGIHTHFIVDKHIFDTKAWKRDDLVLDYSISAESKDFVIALTKLHSKNICVDNNRLRFKPIRKYIDSKMLLGKAFSSYVRDKNEVVVVSFLPIKNIEAKVVAWIVSYEKSPIIKSALSNKLSMRIILFFISVLIIYLLIKQFYSKLKLEKNNIDISNQNILLKSILNSTDNIMFISDDKNITFINDKFKKLLNIKNIDELNKNKNIILELFYKDEGSLHSGLLNKNESSMSLLMRTPEKDRIVTILDKSGKKKIFSIDITNMNVNKNYLVTLTDITKMNEHYMITEKKAYIDNLTQVYNRNKFDEIFKNEFKNTKRYNIPLSISIFDVDKFKLFNDNYGHLIGDEVLAMIAKVVKNSLRETDIFARWGGEEFVILFKSTPVEKANIISQKLKDKIEQSKHSIAGNVTASFGITEYVDTDNIQSIFKRCDDALYIAKQNGRNRIEIL